MGPRPSSATGHHDDAPAVAARPRRGRLVVLVMIAPAAWFLHLNIGVALVPATCELGSELAFHLVSIAAVAVAVTGIVVLARYQAHDDASAFLRWIGLAVGALSIVPIVVVAIAAVPVGVCAP